MNGAPGTQRDERLFPILLGEGLEGFAVDAHDAPLVEHVGSHLLVEVDGGLVPVEDVPLESVATLEGDGGKAAEEGFGDASAAELGTDEEVFEVDAGVAAPRGVEGEVEGEGGGLGHSVFGPFGDEAGEDFLRAEAVAEEVGFGGYDLVGLALVGGQVADESEDLGMSSGVADRILSMEVGSIVDLEYRETAINNDKSRSPSGMTSKKS